MQELECRAVTPEELVGELERSLQRWQENKYDFQVGLKDLEFDFDEEKVEALEMALPFDNIDQAEAALRNLDLWPATLVEDDNTTHRVLAFDPQPVAYSGFMDCVTHSLALTDQGLFEVGRFPAMSVATRDRYWQWFLHRRLATPEQVAGWQRDHGLSPDQLLTRCIETINGG